MADEKPQAGHAGFLRMPAVEELTGLPRSSVYELQKTRGFPKPIKMGVRSFWIRAEVVAWCDERIAEARKAAA